MASGSAQYNQPFNLAEKLAAGKESPPDLITEKLQELLEVFYRNLNLPDTEDSRVSEFFNEVLSEAHWVSDQLDADRRALTKADLSAEVDDLVAVLEDARYKLRRLSDDVIVRLPRGADHLRCADEVDRFVSVIKPAKCSITAGPPKQKPNEVQAAVADEFAQRVLRVAKAHGMAISSTSSQHYEDSTSDAARLLKAIGDHIGLAFSERTWCNRIARIKASDEDLQ